MASLTETAKAVLEGKTLEEGYGSNPYPSVGGGSVSNPDPVDQSTASTGNAKTLNPGTKYKEGRKRSQNGAGAPGSSEFEGVQHDLGGNTPTSQGNLNLGAAAAGDVGKDSSRSSSSSVKGEPTKKLSAMAEEEYYDGEVVEEENAPTLAERLKALKEARKEKEEKMEKCDEELELSEELEDFINEAIEAGLSEEEIMEAIDENFEFISEEEDYLDEEDQLDEFTKKHYVAAVRSKTDPSDYREGDEGKIIARAKKYHGAKFAKDLEGVGPKSHYPRDKKTNEEYDLENYEVDMSEHVNALLEGEDLSEEFHEKATIIFEAAVKAKLEEEVALLEQAYAETLEERVEEIMEQLSTDVDNYLNYVVEQWIEENEVAVESALRSELTEDFISGLRALFAEHYIDIPEDSVNVVEELSSTVEELEEKLNEEMERNVALSSALNESRKADLVISVCEGLTTTQAEKLRVLAENISFTNDDEFVEKIATLRENYFPSVVKSNDDVLDRVDTAKAPGMISESAENLEGPMAKYVHALGRSLPK